MAQNDNFFNRLTRLFRSGPLIKRKVKAARAPNMGTLLQQFQKSQSHVYANAISAYGMYDRMSRYADFQEMEACIAGDTLIATPDGYIEIQELAKKYDSSEAFIVYAYDHEKEQIVPALGKQARKTTTEMSYKVTFDSGKELIATPDHRVMRRDGTYCEVQDLKAGDSMMPFYRRDFFKDQRKDPESGYRWIYTMDFAGSTVKNGWVSEHKLISEWIANRKIKDNEVAHHKNFKKWDNRPENLQIMTAADHQSYRTKILNGQKWDYEKNGVWIEEFKKRHSKFMKENNPAERKDVTFAKILQVCDRDGFNWSHLQRVFDCSDTVITNRLRDNGFSNFTSFARAYDPAWKNNGWDNRGSKNPRFDSKLSFQAICDAFEKGMSSNALAKKIGTTPIKILNRVKAAGYSSYGDFKESFANHKVVSVEPHEIIDLYDLTVDGYKNYATDSIIVHNTPEIASALDIYADESVSQDEVGRCLHIYSENDKIRSVLEELFYDNLNIDFNLNPWVRNLCKYGDFFLFLDISPEYGILNGIPIPVNEIEREEGFDPDDPMAVRFRWVTQGNKILENWQIAHFRLLGNDAFLPYGSSVIEPARRIWRQLILIEDAMLVYRVIRSPERRVFKIDVGNVPPEEVQNYMQQAKSALRSSQVVDKTTGRVDLRYNPLPVWKDTPIPLLDGRTVTIEELSKEIAEGKESWVYSIQDDTHQIVPGKVTWCGKNYTAEKMIKVWLDDNTFVMTAPEHPFVMRDGTNKRADELNNGDSLMPLYREISSAEDGWDVQGYPVVYDPATGKDILLHRRVANSALSKQREEIRKNIDWNVNNNLVVHHKNFNSLDATPSNLEWMGNVDHWKYHASIGCERLIAYNKSDKKRKETSQKNIERNSVSTMSWYNSSNLHKSHNKIRRKAQLKSWATNKEKRSKAMKMVLPQACIDIAINTLQNDPSLNRDRLFETVHKLGSFRDAWEAANAHNNRKYERYGSRTFVHQIKESGYGGFSDFKKQAISGYRNHKVLKVEEIFETSDVYCMTVVGPGGEDDRHNFAVQSLSSNLESSNNGIFLLNSVDEDYFLPVRGQADGTAIDTLAGGQNTTAIEDVEYIQKKLFAALKVPKAYLGYDEMLSSKATLAQEDIRFSRTINKVQRVMISELNKIAAVHLYANGFDGEDLVDFTLKLSNPSTIAQQQKLELFRTKFEIAGQSPEGMLSRDFLRKRVLGLTNEEIKMIEEQKEEDKLRDLEVEAVILPETEGEAASPAGIDLGDEEAAAEEAPEEDLEIAQEKKDDDLLLGTDDVPYKESEKTLSKPSKKEKPVKPSSNVKGPNKPRSANKSYDGRVYQLRPQGSLGYTSSKKERYVNNSLGDKEAIKPGLSVRFESQERQQNQMSAQLKQTLKSLEKSIGNIGKSSALLVEGDNDDET